MCNRLITLSGVIDSAQPQIGVFMSRQIRTSDIVGAHEISERLGGAHTSIVHVWRNRHKDFPKPFLVLQAGMLWDWKEVEAWAKKTKRMI